MGTRADFYIGKGKDAEWIGSIAWDGCRDGIDKQILNCESSAAFRHAVESFFANRDDVTLPEQGWPWPWNTSSTSDCSYWFFNDQVWDEFQDHYAPCSQPEATDENWDVFADDLDSIDYPDMSAIQNVTFGRGSGLIVIGG